MPSPGAPPERRYHSVFEYRGAAPTTIIGLVTGTHYHFARTGARVAVALPDRPSVARVPALRQVE